MSALNPPHVLNAINRELLDDFAAATQQLERDPAVRAVILTGAGRAFSSGFDLKAEAEEGTLPVETWADRFVEDWDIFLGIWRSAKPYVAAVRGYNLGGALERRRGPGSRARHRHQVVADDELDDESVRTRVSARGHPAHRDEADQARP